MKVAFGKSANDTRIFDDQDVDVTDNFSIREVKLIANPHGLTECVVTFINVETIELEQDA